ncbi:MAG: hypothetical protein NZM28_04985 [Fimbriimonadales bacterium]|nr:hypothetical protein [Fimbriimonadales bacterium]
MTDKEVEETYALVSQLHAEYLQRGGVRLPALRNRNGNFTVDALTLVYLARGYPNTQWVSKSELTQFIRQFYPDTNDVQSARHLGMQSGFYIVSTRRGNFLPEDNPPPRGRRTCYYLLRTLKEPHPAFVAQRRLVSDTDFEEIKRRYDYRCATCGSREGESNLRYRQTRTELQQAHCNPKLPLQAENIIPQCQFCNRPDRNYWVYDKRGRVIGVAALRPIQKSIREGYLDEQQVESLYRYLRRRREARERGR